MKETTWKKVKEFEMANDASVDVDKSAPYWTVTIWLKEKVKKTPRFAVQAMKYISTLDAGGGVITFPHPVSGDIYQVETGKGWTPLMPSWKSHFTGCPGPAGTTGTPVARGAGNSSITGVRFVNTRGREETRERSRCFFQKEGGMYFSELGV